MKWLAELLRLIRQLIKQISKKKSDDEINAIKTDPSGEWANRFGRVRNDSTGGVGGNGNPETTGQLPSDRSRSARSK